MKNGTLCLRRFLVLVGFSLLFGCGGSSTDSTPGPIGTPRLETILTGLTAPDFVTGAHDGKNRLFIVEQPGRIKVLQPGSTVATVYLDISSRVLYEGERGLLGLAFHPQFRTNGRFFVNYTRQPDGATVIAEYRQSGTDSNTAFLTETVLMTIPQPYANHNGGMLAFGPDGYLYIGMGDGGAANDPENRAQNAGELLGKILRIDVDRTSGSLPYAIPTDNPFHGTDRGREEIYALGMRNPWRFSFDRLNGTLLVGDVGQAAREEVDIVTRGGNFGWRIREGAACTDIDSGLCSRTDLTAPVAEYDHSGGRCAVTGGYVYRGNRRTLPSGSYVYGDFCSGEIFALENGGVKTVMDTDLLLSSFGEDDTGELYAVDINGRLMRFVPGT